MYASGSPFTRTKSCCSAPTTRPVLPRVSSRTSGFFLCGMMLDPVQNASGRSRKLNSVVDQITHSSAQPLRWVAMSDEIEDELQEEIAVAGDVEAVPCHRIEAELLSHRFAIDRQRRARQRRGAQRQHVDALAAIGQAFAVALELLDVGEEVVRREHRLGALQVRVAGQDDAGLALGRRRRTPAANP